jgi:hypothetical protein
MAATADIIVAATIACAGQTSGQRRWLRGKIESVESLEAAVRSAYGFGTGACLCFSVQTKPEQNKLAQSETHGDLQRALRSFVFLAAVCFLKLRIFKQIRRR